VFKGLSTFENHSLLFRIRVQKKFRWLVS